MSHIGSPVIVRAHMAGVYAGILESITDTTVVLAPGARQIHYWERGGSVPQIAERGIAGSSSRVTAPSTYSLELGPGAQVVQVVRATPEAWARIQAMPPWTGGAP